MHILGEHNGTKTEFYRTNTKSQGLVPAHFALIIIIIIFVVHVVKHQSALINTCRINVPWWAILNIMYDDTMYTVFIIMSCKTILITEVQGPSLISEWNAVMAHSTGTVLVRALAIASLFFRFLCKFTCDVSEPLMLTMRILFCSCLSKVYSCISEPLMLAMRVLFFSCLRNISSIDFKPF